MVRINSSRECNRVALTVKCPNGQKSDSVPAPVVHWHGIGPIEGDRP